MPPAASQSCLVQLHSPPQLLIRLGSLSLQSPSQTLTPSPSWSLSSQQGCSSTCPSQLSSLPLPHISSALGWVLKPSTVLESSQSPSHVVYPSPSSSRQVPHEMDA